MRFSCEDCMFYTYDEEFDDYTCEQDLDEDEMAALEEGDLDEVLDALQHYDQEMKMLGEQEK